MRKVGLYFGSFNPIHIGHLIIAEYMIEHTDLQEIWFVVSPCNPLKNKTSLLDERQRLYMVNLAIEEDERFRACDVEFRLSQPSYTCHTLVHLSEQYPQREFSLIMGKDNLQTIHKWLNYQWILDNYEIFVYPRTGYSASSSFENARIRYVDAPRIEMSATMIRENIRNRHSVKYMLPYKVFECIEEMGYYTQKKLNPSNLD